MYGYLNVKLKMVQEPQIWPGSNRIMQCDAGPVKPCYQLSILLICLQRRWLFSGSCKNWLGVTEPYYRGASL